MSYDLETFARSGNSDADYFRTNEWGMGLLKSAMRGAKILDTDHQPPVWIGKFCSNDGWLVVPEECVLIADALDQLDAFTYYQDEGNMLIDHTTQSMYLVKDFAGYCRHAANHGGFHVW